MSVRSLQERLYPPATRLDPQAEFLATLEEFIRPEHHVLDLGAGAGELNRYQFKGRVRRMVGIDLDERVARNPLLDKGVVGDICRLPFADDSFDVAFAIYVLEHLADPARFTQEVSRVLKPGGVFVCLTPNRRHYVATIASLTPFAFHQWYNKLRGRDEDDTFPTLYRLNSRRALEQHFGNAGCSPIQVRMIEPQPNYLMFSTPTLLAGAAYERLVNATDWLADFRVNIIGAYRKDGVAAQQTRRAA
jgi:SAM-dependent methyltransferase